MIDVLICICAFLAFLGFLARPQGHSRRAATKNRRI